MTAVHQLDNQNIRLQVIKSRPHLSDCGCLNRVTVGVAYILVTEQALRCEYRVPLLPTLQVL